MNKVYLPKKKDCVATLLCSIYNERRKYLKTLQELTLLSKFLFDQTMDMPQAHEAALRIILGDQNLKLMSPVQTEKEFRTAPWLRTIRLDVFSVDEERRIYDTEMQSERRNDLKKRSRYYQGLIDASLLEPGSISFNRLNDTFVIMITPFDLFGKGRYYYTFRSYCEEDRSISLDDGAVRIFLNTRGTNDSEVRKELVDFLHYIETTDEYAAQCSGSENIRKIHDCVSQIKASEEIGVKYMQTWEEKVIEREKGREEGRTRGKAESILDLLEDLGAIPRELEQFIFAQEDISILKEWHKIAARVQSMEEFEEKIGFMPSEA